MLIHPRSIPWLALLALAASAILGLACATGSTPVSSDPIDWAEANDRWSIHVVTVDPDGDERVTRIWLAEIDGQGVLRTGDSRWWSNLQREPRIRIRMSGTDYPFDIEFVTEAAEKIRIDEVFLEKYGGWEKMMFPQDRGETHDNYARLVAARSR